MSLLTSVKTSSGWIATQRLLNGNTVTRLVGPDQDMGLRDLALRCSFVMIT